ncbi:hypothetical protein NliqN6_5652 [Naganishia liquefaciens]|uniref:Sel1 repeat family protein n=1 Tax=Naganishia liquefaciens TaxID=104408 RepID=A0A8H3TYL8_9TREE|nr:hypothetical protein NliqN6_5652 [Naganishia liquefaciens]
MVQSVTKKDPSPRLYPRQRISSKEGFDSPLALLAKQAARNGLTFATPDLVAADQEPATSNISQPPATQQSRPPLLINSFRDSFSTLSSRRSSSQTIMTLSPPEDGDVSFFSSGMSQRLSTADSVASEYSLDSAVGVGSEAREGTREMVYASPTAHAAIDEPTQKKGFVRLTGARMARTLEASAPESSSTPWANQDSNAQSRSATPNAAPAMPDLSRQMQQTHMQASAAGAADTANDKFWDSSRYNPGSISQIIPSLPISTVSSAPVLRRDMSISRKSMVGEMGEYEYERDDDGLGRGKAGESSRQSQPALGQRHSRIHYTRRPAPPPPPVPTIPANFRNDNGRENAAAGPSSARGEPQRTSSSAQRSPSIRNPPSIDQSSYQGRPVDDPRRPSCTRLTTEERRAKIAEDYLTRGIAAHNDTTGMHDLTESAYYFRKAAEGGSSGGCVLYGLALRHGWGVAQDEKAAFNWFGKACEMTMLADEIQVENSDLLAKKTKSKLTPELIMALYEVGNCFFHGWGLPHPDYLMAVSYFKLAAEAGDKDAQEQLGLILSQGKPGVKKNMHEAAKWYRTAIAQGASGVGLSWVYKDKYMDGEKT